MPVVKSEAADDLFFVFVEGKVAGYFRQVTIGGEPYWQLHRWGGISGEELGSVSGAHETAAVVIESAHRTRNRNRS